MILHAITLTAFLTFLTGDLVTTCRNFSNGEHELNPLALSSCPGVTLQAGVSAGGAIYLLEAKHAPLWAKIVVYGGLAGSHGWAMHRNLRK